MPNNYPLTIAGRRGTIYYTTDGVTDPRSIGGGVNPSAAVKQYTGSVPISGRRRSRPACAPPADSGRASSRRRSTTVALPGDYNGNGSVEPTDYTVWKSSFGDTVAAGSGADGNGNGVVDTADYAVWRDNMGTSLGLGGGAGSMGQRNRSTADRIDRHGIDRRGRRRGIATDVLRGGRYAAVAVGYDGSFAYSRSLGSGRSAFDNLLLAAARPASSRPADTTLDRHLTNWPPISPTMISTLPTPSYLAVLADDALGPAGSAAVG